MPVRTIECMKFPKTAQFLAEKTVMDLLHDRNSRTQTEYLVSRLRSDSKLGRPLVAIDEDASIGAAFQLCQEANVLAIPTYRIHNNGTLKTFTAIVSVSDMFYYAMLQPGFSDEELLQELANNSNGDVLMDTEESQQRLVNWMENKKELLQQPIKRVVEAKHGKDAQLRLVKTTDSILSLLEAFERLGTETSHRVLCYDPDHLHVESYLTILTQTDLISYLLLNRDSLDEDLWNAPIGEFVQKATTLEEHSHPSRRPEIAQTGLHYLVTVPYTVSALVATRMMYLYNVSCVGIVDEQGRLVGNLSSADFRGFSGEKVRSLMTEIVTFIKEASGEDPFKWNLMVEYDDKLLDVVGSILKRHFHRAWVCEDHKPKGLVTLTDILSGVYAGAQGNL